jgi:Protein of unknown function (DUF2490)
VKHKINILCLLPWLLPVVAQSQTNTQTGWLASFNTFKINSKFSVHLDVQARSTDDYEQWQTFLFRPGLNMNVGKNKIVTAGYAFIPNRFSSGGISGLLPEHRLWQQFIVIQPVKKAVSIQHRFRFEERFIPVAEAKDGSLEKKETLFATRLRYFARSVIPLQNNDSFTRGLFAALQNEVFVNTSPSKM